MNREDLEHIIRASGDVTNEYEFVIVGSQAILGSIPYPEPVFKMSAEADIYPLNAPDLADRIDGSIGEGSRFHESNGYYAQGVGPDTAVLASGWQNRLHRIASAIALMCWISSSPRPRRGAIRTGCFAWH